MAVDYDELKPRVDITENGIRIETRVNTMMPARFDFPIVQGQTLSLRIVWVDDSKTVVDLSSGYTARLKVKQDFASSSTLISLTDSDGITLASSAPNIIVARTAAQTAAYTGFTRARYDLELVTGSTVTRLMAGFATLLREVTA